MALGKLTPAELLKKNSSTGEPRIDILMNAIVKGIALPLVDGSELVLDNSDENKSAVENFKVEGKTFNLKAKTGQRVIKSSDIGKSPLFGGGGGGAGGGTQQTAIVESMQCVYLQAMLDNPGKELAFFNPSVMKKAYAKCEVGGTTFEQIRDFDASWHLSAFKSAEIILAKGYVNKNQVFHRDSDTMKKIYAMKKEAFRNSGLDPLTDDKWNPGDIWAVHKNFDVSTMRTRTIQEYNEDILKAFKSKNDSNKRPAALRYVESKTQGQQRNNTFFSSKGGQIIYSDGKMECRPNSQLAVIKAEIVGKTARGGGASWGVISDIVKDVANVTLPNNSAIVNAAKAMKRGDKTAINKFWLDAKLVNKNIKEKEFKEEIPNCELEWIHGKYGVCTLLSTLQRKKGAKANEIVNSIHNYAGSQSKLSSVYIKVYE
jgi:hypothetical protein